VAHSLGNLASIYCVQGEYERAENMQTEALMMRREIGNRMGEAYSLKDLALVYFELGDYARSAELHCQSLTIRCETGHREGLCAQLAACGCLLASAGQLPGAAECLYGATHHASALGLSFNSLDRDFSSRGQALVEHPEAGLPSAECEQLKAQAEAMSLDQLTEFALAELAKLKNELQQAEADQQAGA
jgi:hypothetical protein